MPVAKEQIRQIIADNNLNSVADVYTLLRDSFKDILQELMVCNGSKTVDNGRIETMSRLPEQSSFSIGKVTV